MTDTSYICLHILLSFDISSKPHFHWHFLVHQSPAYKLNPTYAWLDLGPANTWWSLFPYFWWIGDHFILLPQPGDHSFFKIIFLPTFTDYCVSFVTHILVIIPPIPDESFVCDNVSFSSPWSCDHWVLTFGHKDCNRGGGDANNWSKICY